MRLLQHGLRREWALCASSALLLTASSSHIEHGRADWSMHSRARSSGKKRKRNERGRLDECSNRVQRREIALHYAALQPCVGH